MLLIVLQLLSFPSLIASEERNDATTVFENCDVESYYRNHRDGNWGWDRVEIASLLLQTHQQVVPDDAIAQFFSGEFSIDISQLSRPYARGTNTREALTELDKGKYTRRNKDNSTIDTVHMMFTNTDVPVEDFIVGWEPGYLWPMDDVTLHAYGEEDDLEEAIAAIHDLHNIRPRHPIVHYGQRTNDWFYDTCLDCKLAQDEISVEQQLAGSLADTPQGRNGVNQEGGEKQVQMGGDNSSEDDEGSDHLCVCTKEHALQPPKQARGEVARALLYMNLRYGTETATHRGRNRARKGSLRSSRLHNGDYLELALTDCHPFLENEGYNDDLLKRSSTSNKIGYFSRLVEWHLQDPPNQREIDRNNLICERYQGNRNPFVDFYEESWALLDFEKIEREKCPFGIGIGDDDFSTIPSDDFSSGIPSVEEWNLEASHSNDETKRQKTTTGIKSEGFGCGDLMPGDLSFFMVQPSVTKNDSTNPILIEEEQESFGLVTLVDLKPGLVLYVVGVDDNLDGTDLQVTFEGGVLKLEVPERGISNGSYFGYGNRLFLGTQWEPVLEDGEDKKDFEFSVHQLYAYCEEKNDEKDEYKILAALSTTGQNFGNNQLPSYWEHFKNKHSDAKLSENFGSGKHYGLIVLPEDASNRQSSGGYRYIGPAFTEHDPYAKALINEAYWERINSLDGVETIYGFAQNEVFPTEEIIMQPRFDAGAFDISSSGDDNDDSNVSGRISKDRDEDSGNDSSSGSAPRSKGSSLINSSIVVFTACITYLFC